MIGENGGGAFFVTYLLCAIFVAIPVMASKFFIGRRANKNVMGAVKTFKPHTKGWKAIGVFSVLAAYF